MGGRGRFRHGGLLVAAIALLNHAAVAGATPQTDFRAPLDAHFTAHCLACHQGADAEAGLDLSLLSPDLGDPEVLRRWTRVHDRMASGEMPPAEMPRPPANETSAVLKTLARALTDADRSRAQVVLRRLNRVEYENTVRDLFDVDVRLQDLLPQDTSLAGFDNVGEGLAVSAEAMQAYLKAADAALDAVFGPDQPPKSIELTTNLLDQRGHDGKSRIDKFLGTMFRKTDRGVVIFQSGYCPTNLVNFSRLRPPAGLYRVRMEVRAVQSDGPVTLCVYGGDTLVNRRERHLVGYFDIPPEQWTTLEFEDRLVEDGGSFQPKCYGTSDIRKGADTYTGPGIEIGDIDIEGPLDPWPPRSRKKLLGGLELENMTREDAQAILADLLPRAFRRPTQPDEVEPYVALVGEALEEGQSPESALRRGLKGILCSPEFLFLEEPADEKVISQHALAARLSYFLWSSSPDAELMSLADAGQLNDPQVLHNQVERLLSDPKAVSLTKNFAGQWLDLREVDFTEPDANLYPEFDELLKISMVEETERYFHHVLENDLSVSTFIDSDFTFLNERLAEHYGIGGVQGQEFRKVSLPPESVRGGLLTQASVLKVTANGTNTSPILRGTWILERILGQPVPPPPDEVGSVGPDIRGATTLRQQLAKHRDRDSCARCHQHIDPPGFALENFDPIGGWREAYRTTGEGDRPEIKRAPFTYAWVRYRIGLPVDATGETAAGERFEDVREFKKLLARDPHLITRSLTEKLLTFGLGRRIGFSDRAAVDAIVERAGQQNHGFRTLVHEVVQSQTFHQP